VGRIAGYKETDRTTPSRVEEVRRESLRQLKQLTKDRPGQADATIGPPTTRLAGAPAGGVVENKLQAQSMKHAGRCDKSAMPNETKDAGDEFWSGSQFMWRLLGEELKEEVFQLFSFVERPDDDHSSRVNEEAEKLDNVSGDPDPLIWIDAGRA